MEGASPVVWGRGARAPAFAPRRVSLKVGSTGTPPTHGNSRDTIHGLRFAADHHAETAVALPGDGTVTARSALAQNPDGTPGPIPWTRTDPYHASHMTLPAQPDFIETLIETLLS